MFQILKYEDFKFFLVIYNNKLITFGLLTVGHLRTSPGGNVVNYNWHFLTIYLTSCRQNDKIHIRSINNENNCW